MGTFSKWSILLVIVTMAVALGSCEEELGKTAQKAFIIEIVDDGSGQCTYYMSPSPDDHTRKNKMVAACGAYQVGEGIFIPQDK